MPLPTLTWTQGAMQSGSGALTTIQALTLIKAAIDADAGLWAVKSSDLVGAYPYVELGLAAGPSGNDLDTARLLLFGGATPNTAALEATGTDAAGAVAIFTYLALNPSGAVGDYRAVDPYATATRKLKGKIFLNAMPSVGTPYVYTLQSSEGMVIVFNAGSTSGAHTIVCGRMIEQNITPVWCLGTGFGALTGFISTLTTSGTASTCVAGLTEAVNSASLRAIIGSTVYTVGRMFTDLTLLAPGLSNAALGFTLHAIALAGRVRGSASPYEFFGFVRQIRYGASTADRSIITSGGVQAFGFGPSLAASTVNHLYVDQQA